MSNLRSQRRTDYRQLFSRRSRIATPVPNWAQLQELPNVLDRITSLVLQGDDGIAHFKTLLLTTKWLKKSALRDSVLQKWNFTSQRDYAFWSQKYHHKNPLFLRLLRARNPEAVYIEAIRLAFNKSEIDAAIILIETIMEHQRRAKILFFVFDRFIGNR